MYWWHLLPFRKVVDLDGIHMVKLTCCWKCQWLQHKINPHPLTFAAQLVWWVQSKEYRVVICKLKLDYCCNRSWSLVLVSSELSGTIFFYRRNVLGVVPNQIVDIFSKNAQQPWDNIDHLLVNQTGLSQTLKTCAKTTLYGIISQGDITQTFRPCFFDSLVRFSADSSKKKPTHGLPVK